MTTYDPTTPPEGYDDDMNLDRAENARINPDPDTDPAARILAVAEELAAALANEYALDEDGARVVSHAVRDYRNAPADRKPAAAAYIRQVAVPMKERAESYARTLRIILAAVDATDQ